MLYFDNNIISKIGFTWEETIHEIEKAINCMYKNDWSQPIKPYLRYRNSDNRIIAMPAYVGGDINVAGIKWISSFPENIKKGIPRAHCIVVLNDSNTGVPISIFNASLISIIRTCSVSGLIINNYCKRNCKNFYVIGIIGWGPIGQYHYRMVKSLLGNKIKKIHIFDINQIDSIDIEDDRVEIVDCWEKAYEGADIFITCTVATKRYIDKCPKGGALLLNISLRDYKTSIYEVVKDTIIVDDWEEVCRENTDIENMYKECGLRREMTHNLQDVLYNDYLQYVKDNQPIMFNPMGMGIFDLAIANYFYQKGMIKGKGVIL